MRKLILALIAIMVATAVPAAFAQAKQAKNPARANNSTAKTLPKATPTPDWLVGIWVKPADDGDYELHISNKEVEMYFIDEEGSNLLYSGTFAIRGNKLISDDKRFTLNLKPKDYTFTDPNTDPNVPWEPICDDYVEDDADTTIQNTIVAIVPDRGVDAPTPTSTDSNPEQDSDSYNKIYNMKDLEVFPEFPGGQQAMYTWLCKNIKYPAAAAKARLQGRVVVSFVIDKDGSITDVKTAVGAHPDLDEEAMRLVREMPRWSPGSYKNKPVKVHYTLPITFKL